MTPISSHIEDRETENRNRNFISDVTNDSKRPKQIVISEQDKMIVEDAIYSRKGELEKNAEQRAELVFKQWYKEKKSLEQVIDETLR